MGSTMHLSIPSILLGLGGKCLINWTLVLLQRSHTCDCFIGVFMVSLTAADTILTLTLTILHIQGDGCLLGLRLTRHHVCLLLQILGEVYNSLQWPVVFTTCLDHYLTVSKRLQNIRARRITYSFVTGLLWNMAALYVFLVSGFSPVLENGSPSQLRKCWIFCAPQISHISAAVLLLFLTVSCAMFSRTGFPKLKLSPSRLARNQSKAQLTQMDHSDSPSAGEIVAQALRIFLNIWSFFLVFLALSLMLPVGIPSHLGLNVPWLCFLNSVSIGVVLCASRPASQLVQGVVDVPPDIFCDWRFSSVEEDRITAAVDQEVEQVIQ